MPLRRVPGNANDCSLTGQDSDSGAAATTRRQHSTDRRLLHGTNRMVAIETVDYEGAGRGLVAVTPIAAGELVLRESPVILTVTQELHQAVCAHCLRYTSGELFACARCIKSQIGCRCLAVLSQIALLIAADAAMQCLTCKQASFCNKRCQERAARQSHSANICRCRAC